MHCSWTPQQRALWRGCLDALLLDAAIAKEARDQKQTLSVAWVDYRKAFDLVPHKWLDNYVGVNQDPKPVQDTVRRIVPLWRSLTLLHGESGTAKCLYQGDSLSPPPILSGNCPPITRPATGPMATGVSSSAGRSPTSCSGTI